MKTIAILLMALMPLVAHAMPAVSKGGHVACASEQWLKDMVAFTGSGDRQSFNRYIEVHRCVVMKEGLRVTVTDAPGMFGGRTEFIFNGTRFWTVREAFDYNP